MKTFIATFATVIMAVSTAFAQVTFEAVDADASGSVSLEEATEAGFSEDAFTVADANADGELTAEEFASIEQ